MVHTALAISEPISAQSRVSFTFFPTSDDPMLLAWMRFRGALTGPAASVPGSVGPSAVRDGTGVLADQRVTGATRSAAAGGAPGFWRLIATNNRELGRSFHLYRSFEHARAHVAHTQEKPDALQVVFVSGPSRADKGWVLTVDGSPVMTCSRWYTSVSTRATAASVARDALASARLADLPDHCGPSGRFVRRAPAGAVIRVR